MRCDTCGEARAITLVHTLKLGKRKIVWISCVPCELAERRAHGEVH